MNGLGRHVGSGGHALGSAPGRRGKADFDIQSCKHLNNSPDDGGFARTGAAGDNDYALACRKADGVRLKRRKFYAGIRLNLCDLGIGVEKRYIDFGVA